MTNPYHDAGFLTCKTALMSIVIRLVALQGEEETRRLLGIGTRIGGIGQETDAFLDRLVEYESALLPEEVRA